MRPINSLVIASGNGGKLKEFSRLTVPLGLEVYPQSEFGIQSPEETGTTFVENALLKARHCARLSGRAALADDSGLCVDALGGAPGIYSARYSGEDGGDRANNEKLLSALTSVPAGQRGATFVCVIVMMRYADDPMPLIAQGRWRGTIASVPRGANGFGYDPLFEVPGMDLTAAQLSAGQKDSLSHRGQALQAFAAGLKADETGVFASA